MERVQEEEVVEEDDDEASSADGGSSMGGSRRTSRPPSSKPDGEPERKHDASLDPPSGSGIGDDALNFVATSDAYGTNGLGARTAAGTAGSHGGSVSSAW